MKGSERKIISEEREAKLREEPSGKLLPKGRIVFHYHEGRYRDPLYGNHSFSEGERPPCTEGISGTPEGSPCKCGKHIEIWIPAYRIYPGEPRNDLTTGLALGDYFVIEKSEDERK